MMDDYERALVGFYARFCAWATAITAVLLLLVGFTLLPHIGSTTAQLLGGASALVGIAAGFAIAAYQSKETC
jgi:uncharacterized RDD family membrane protein YckC